MGGNFKCQYISTLLSCENLHSRYVIGLKNCFRHKVVNLSTMSSKPKIFVTRSDFPSNGIELLKSKYDVSTWDSKTKVITKDDIIKNLPGTSALFCSLNDKIDKEVLLSAGPSLKVVASMSVGVDHIDLAECRTLGIKVGYTPNVLTEATAELTIALLLATSRRLFEANQQLRTGGWSSWSPLWMCGPALKGSTVGIIGLGRIGQEVARKLKSFNVGKIIYTGRRDVKEAKELGATKCNLESLLKLSDFVIATCALTPQTKGLFTAERFALMKPTAIFINTSRGALVDHDALYKALKGGKIHAAGLDVMTPEPLPTDHPLLQLNNCVLLPHIGSATNEARKAMSELTARNIIAGLEQTPLPAEYIS
uniref:Glyoxylate reductase/hydroxypyruvate reductase n=3 Tax=Clastoptera arizonana TaxID=38151 RepID=A0A1B6E3I2_9HEMI